MAAERRISSPVTLSVLITCLNAADTIGGQLEALAAQRWSEPWEVVVADGGSTDETLGVVESFTERLPGLRVVDASDRRGIAHGFNVAAAASRGAYLAFCEADDEVGAGWVSAVAEALRANELVGCPGEPTKLNPSWILASRETTPRLERVWFPPFLEHASTLGLGIRRVLFERIGGFDEEFRAMQDADLCFRAQLAGAELVLAPDAVVHYRFRTAFRDIYRQARLYAECFAQLQRKYQPAGTRPRGAWKWPFSHWRPILRQLGGVGDRAGRARLAWLLGWQMGRFRGSVKHRVLAT
jgi:glycosyltransferase involved in cell wall biosynthesis